MTTSPFTVWLTGPDPAGLDAVADEVLRRLAARQLAVEPIDLHLPALAAAGDAPGAAIVAAALLARHGVATVVALAASQAVRDRARAELGRLIEVEVRPAAGTTAPGHEPPLRAEVEVVLATTSATAGADRVVRALELLGFLDARAGAGYSEDEERAVIRRLKAFGYL